MVRPLSSLIVCPSCRGALAQELEQLRCGACGEVIPVHDGFPRTDASNREATWPTFDRRAHEVYLLVREILLNAARHAGATVASLEATLKGGWVTIVVADNGHGFGFKGRYDHATLAVLQIGPVSLRERAALLGGTLTVDSTDRGTRLEISFPTDPSRP